MIDLIDRASSDPEFLQRLQADPYGTARASGVEVSHSALQELLGMQNASEAEVAEALQARLSFATKGSDAPSNSSLANFQLAGSDGNITN